MVSQKSIVLIKEWTKKDLVSMEQIELNMIEWHTWNLLGIKIGPNWELINNMLTESVQLWEIK